MREKNTKKILPKIIFLIIISGVILFLLAALIGFIGNVKDFSFAKVLDAFSVPFVWILWAAVLIGFALFLLFDTNIIGGNRILKINKDLEDSHFLTFKELKDNKGITITKLSRLHEVNDGVPVFAEAKNGDIDIVLVKPIHTEIIGSTGSGKTTTYVNPTIEILSRTKTKPSMVITDPKGELYRLHSAGLKERGYTLHLIDLDNIYYSSRWNPFNDIWEKTDRYNNVEIEQKNGKYYFDGKELLTYAEAERSLIVFKQQICDECYVDLQDLIYSICPIESKNEPGWQKAARNLILALANGFWEDVRDGYMTKKQFNLFNLYKNICEFCIGECDVIKDYFDYRDFKSKVKGLSNTVMVSQDRTLSSYLGEVNQYFDWMADTGISALTSGNDIDLSNFDEEPTVLFLKVPDERQNRHKLVTVLITQMYKALVAKAGRNLRSGKTKDAELLRNTYLILDEFANMPKFNNLDAIVTVGRSRKIFMNMIIQSYSQLDNKYGKEVADIVKGMCNIKIFIGTDNQSTIKEFSEACGKKKVKNVSLSEQKDASLSTRAESVPLIYPIELQQLNDPKAGASKMGNTVAIIDGKPFFGKMTPAFAVKNYAFKEPVSVKEEAIVFYEDEYYYDISKRAAFLAEVKELENTEINSFMASLSEDDGYNEAEDLSEEAFRIYKNVDRKLKTLQGRIPIDIYNRIMNSDINTKLEILDGLLNEVAAKRNNFLLFDLTYMKNFIKDTCFASEESK